MTGEVSAFFSRLVLRYPLVALAFLMALPEEAQVEWRQMYLYQWREIAARLGV